MKSRPAAAALLVLGGMGASPLLADGEFILQPSMRSPSSVTALSGTVQSGQPVAVPPIAKQPIAVPPANKPRIAEPRTAKPQTAKPQTAEPQIAEPTVEFRSASESRPGLVAAEPLAIADPASTSNASLVDSGLIRSASNPSGLLRSLPPAPASEQSASDRAASEQSASDRAAFEQAASAKYADLTTAPPAAAGPQHAPASAGTQGLQWISRDQRRQPESDSQSVGSFATSGAESASTATASPAPLPGNTSADGRPTPSPPFSLASVRATPQGSAGPALAGGELAGGQSAGGRLTHAAPTRAVLASRVSNQIMSGRPAADEVGRSVDAIDNPPGWQAIGEELTQRLGKCEALINRQAYFSAREDAETAMLYLVRVLDLMSNHYYSEPAWHAASKAMSEAEDFSNAQRLTSDSDFLRRVILSHETPVLKDADAATLAPMAAAQHYRQYAEDKLVEAAQGHPWASDVLYALGRSYQSQADATQAGLQQHLRWRAITLYRGARVIAPSNAAAANQLGYVLLQMDRPADAREALMASINAAPSLAAYENLVEASRRLGDVNTSNWAMQQAVANKTAAPVGQGVPEFVEVDPRTFAAMSPYSIGPNSQPPQAPAQAYRTATANSASR